MLKEEGAGILRAEVGQSVSLTCNYQMMGDYLYSSMWYRDDKEFFRSIPRGQLQVNLIIKRYNCVLESPPVTIFLISGISVDDLSSPTNIIIKNVSLSSSGSVKCEVSAGPPR